MGSFVEENGIVVDWNLSETIWRLAGEHSRAMRNGAAGNAIMERGGFLQIS